MPAISVYLSKRRAGKIVPFTRFYLVNFDERHLIERMFKYSIVMPMNEAYLDRVTKCTPVKLSRHHIEATLVDDPADIMSAEERKARWTKLLGLDAGNEWVFVFPLLPRGDQNFAPRDLGADWSVTSRKEGKRDTQPFTELAYLQLPDRKVRPPCLICPRYLQQQAGECSLGQQICYTTLSLKSTDNAEEVFDETEQTLSEDF